MVEVVEEVICLLNISPKPTVIYLVDLKQDKITVPGPGSTTVKPLALPLKERLYLLSSVKF